MHDTYKYILPPITNATIKMYKISENPEKFLESYLPYVDIPYQGSITLNEKDKTYHVRYMMTKNLWTSFDLLAIKGVSRPLDIDTEKTAILVDIILGGGAFYFQVVYDKNTNALQFRAMYDYESDDYNYNYDYYDHDCGYKIYKLLDNYKPKDWVEFSIYKIYNTKTTRYSNSIEILDGSRSNLIVPFNFIVKVTTASTRQPIIFKKTFGIPAIEMQMQISVLNAEYKYLAAKRVCNPKY